MKDHISYTQISTYLACPLKYNFQYVEQAAWPFKPEGLVFGSAIHQALEHYYLGRKESRDVPIPELVAIYDAAWEKESSENTVLFKNGNTAEKLLQSAEAMLKAFKEGVQPGEVIAVEQPFSVDMVDPESGESLGVPLAGRIDLVERLENQSIAVVDQKTAARAYDKDKVEQDLQLTAYSYVMARQGHTLDELQLRFDVLLKNGSYKLLSYKTSRSMEDLKRFYKTARSVLRAVQAQAFYPVRSWMCTDCPFADKCSKW